MNVLVDETYHKIDDSHYCFIAMHIIASDSAVVQFREWYSRHFLPDTIRYKQKRKVHYTDEDNAAKQSLVEAVKALELTAKAYVWYGTGKADKRSVIDWSMGYQKQTAPQSMFYIEQCGNEYDDLSSDSVHICNNDDYPELAIADIYAGVYVSKILSKQEDEFIAKLYSFLRPRIRLEIIHEFDGQIKKRTRTQITR